MSKSITVDVISDMVCPWCYLGRQRLHQAISMLPELDVDIMWKPFFLTPQMPLNGKPYNMHMRDIMGNQNAVDEQERALRNLGEEDGIEFDFEAIKIAPHSMDAHRTVYWAAQDEKHVQDKLVKELFSRYFEQGQNIGDKNVLVDATTVVGMRGDVIAKLLETEIDLDTILKDVALANHIGVKGVPCFIIDKKFVVMGAQSADILADALQQTADGFEPGPVEDR